jgi:hypothetical protein
MITLAANGGHGGDGIGVIGDGGCAANGGGGGKRWQWRRMVATATATHGCDGDGGGGHWWQWRRSPETRACLSLAAMGATLRETGDEGSVDGQLKATKTVRVHARNKHHRVDVKVVLMGKVKVRKNYCFDVKMVSMDSLRPQDGSFTQEIRTTYLAAHVAVQTRMGVEAEQTMTTRIVHMLIAHRLD